VLVAGAMLVAENFGVFHEDGVAMRLVGHCVIARKKRVRE
jgi:hypothetical protein